MKDLTSSESQSIHDEMDDEYIRIYELADKLSDECLCTTDLNKHVVEMIRELQDIDELEAAPLSRASSLFIEASNVLWYEVTVVHSCYEDHKARILERRQKKDVEDE